MHTNIHTQCYCSACPRTCVRPTNSGAPLCNFSNTLFRESSGVHAHAHVATSGTNWTFCRTAGTARRLIRANVCPFERECVATHARFGTLVKQNVKQSNHQLEEAAQHCAAFDQDIPIGFCRTAVRGLLYWPSSVHPIWGAIRNVIEPAQYDYDTTVAVSLERHKNPDVLVHLSWHNMWLRLTFWMIHAYTQFMFVSIKVNRLCRPFNALVHF